MNESTIRIAQETDVDACVRLALIAAPGGGGSPDPEVWRRALGRDVDEPDRLLVVAVVDDEIVGYARAHVVGPATGAASDEPPPGVYLIGLWLRPEHRRKGLGAALTAARLEWAAGRASDAWFFTKARNSASIELHERFGFEEAARRFSFGGVAYEDGKNILFRARLDGHPDR